MRTIDLWAGSHPGTAVTGQVGTDGYVPKNFPWVRHFSDAGQRDAALNRATLLVCDVNIELLIEAAKRGVPALVVPRRPIFGEEHSDTQSVLAMRLARHRNLEIADNEAALVASLDRWADGRALRAHAGTQSGGSAANRRSLLDALRSEVASR